jgi:polysaccharide biosynthesis protein PslG
MVAATLSQGATVIAAQATTAAAGYNSTVLADHPQYYFPLNESSGPVRDATGNEAASTMNTARLGAAGVQGTAASFDGVGQRVQVPYRPDMKLTGSFSIELWAKLPASPQTSGYPSLYSRGSGNPGHFGAVMWISPNAAHLVNFKRNGKNVPSARGLSSTAYRHLVFSWDAPQNRYTWYIDGTLDISGLMPAIRGVDTETAPLSIGAVKDFVSTPAHSFGKASIDGLAVYRHLLPAARVGAHYAAANAGRATPGPGVRRVGGIGVGDLQPWNTRRAADFAAWKGANATYIRSDLSWMYLQPTATTWRWNLYDGVLADANHNGLKYLAILGGIPNWANGNTGEWTPPTNLALLTNYCYQTVKHFLPRGVTAYELGNEVNYVHRGWDATGGSYAHKFLIPCVSGARRAAAELHRPVNLMFGSMAPGTGVARREPVAFLTEAYANGARGKTDTLAFHPYGGLNPTVEPNMVTLPNKLRAVMKANGEGTHIMWATEYGVATAGNRSWSEPVQAEWIKAAYDAWAAHPYAGPLIWYAGRDTGTSPTAAEQHFGILRHDGSPKPGWEALRAKLIR